MSPLPLLPDSLAKPFARVLATIIDNHNDKVSEPYEDTEDYLKLPMRLQHAASLVSSVLFAVRTELTEKELRDAP
jgi:hypothetical protein